MGFRRAAVAIALYLFFAPASASAGTYDVWLCRTAEGSPASTDGWTTYDLINAATGADRCADTWRPRLESAMPANRPVPHGTIVGWAFTAPAATTIANYTLWRTVRPAYGGVIPSEGYWAHMYTLNEDVPGVDLDYSVESCIESSPYSQCPARGDPSSPYSPANRISRADVDAKRLFATMVCYGRVSSCPAVATPGQVNIYAARIGLTESKMPVLSSAPTGSLLDSSATITGERSLRFAARDEGGGIARVGIVVDGRAVVGRALDTGSTRCAKPYKFTVPCPRSGEATLAFDTAQLPNGGHAVQASVTDVAGNETRSDPVTVTTLNGSQPNGRGATRFVKLSAWLRSKRDKPRRAAVVPFGAVRFAEGRLTDSSRRSIAGAVLQVTSRVQRAGARTTNIGTVTTGEDGRFAYRIAKGPSRTVRFAYKAYTLDPAPVSTAAISLGVKAGLELRVKPRNVRNGQKIRFLGRLKGGPSRKGTRVTIDVLVPDARRRVPIGNVKADGNGRFRFGYRFRRTLVRARYRFQARLTAQPAYPYRGATSRRVSVVVTP